MNQNYSETHFVNPTLLAICTVKCFFFRNAVSLFFTMVLRMSTCWHNGSTLVFCAGDPEPIPTSAQACGEATGCHAGHREVGRCSTRGGSQGMYITFTSTKVNKAEPIHVLKPRINVTSNPKHG